MHQGQLQLTNCKVEGGPDQQAWNGTKSTSILHAAETLLTGMKGARKSHDSPAGSRVGFVSKLKRVPETSATHHLQNQEWAWLAGLKWNKRHQHLTCCRDLINRHERSQEEPWLTCRSRVGWVSKLRRVWGTLATHCLQNQENA